MIKAKSDLVRLKYGKLLELFVSVRTVYSAKNSTTVILPGSSRNLWFICFFLSLFYEGHRGSTSASSKMLDGYALRIEQGQTGVNFSIKGTDEVILLIEDEAASNLKFKIALGAQENSVSYLSLVSKGKQNLHCVSSSISKC